MFLTADRPGFEPACGPSQGAFDAALPCPESSVPAASVQAEPTPASSSPLAVSPDPAKQKMGLLSVTALVFGVQVGSGVFLLPNELAPYGVWGVAAWGIAGAGALALCQVFAVLASLFPRAGGPHVYVGQAFGRQAAFYVAWAYWVMSWVSTVPVLAFALRSLEEVVGPMSAGGRVGLETVLLAGIALLNLRGAGLAGLGEIFFSCLKLLPLLIIPLLSIPFWKTGQLLAPASYGPLHCLNAASMVSFWGFVGLEAGTAVADCVENAAVVVPRGLFWGTLLVLILYVVNSCSVMMVLPQDALLGGSNAYGAVLATIVGPRWGPLISQGISGVMFLVCLGTVNAWTLSSAHVALTAAQEKVFPEFFARSNRFGSPIAGVLLFVGPLLASLLALTHWDLSRIIGVLVKISTAIFILIYLAAVCALVRFIAQGRVKAGRALWGAVLISLGFCIWAGLAMDQAALMGAVGLLACGFAFMWLFRWPTSGRTPSVRRVAKGAARQARLRDAPK